MKNAVGLDPFVVSSAIIIAVLYTVYFVSMVKILHRMGLSGWWSLMIFLWPVGIVMLAYSQWPTLDQKSN